MNQQHLDVAIEAAKAGASELLSRWGSRTVSEKAPKDLVTDADLASQKAIRSILMDAFDGYAFVGEEEGENDPPESVRLGQADAPPCWVVDPLDGTVNYVHRLQSFAVSIGLYHNGKMRLGVILDPVTNELFSAVDGQGAHLNGVPIHVSDCTDLSQALIACSFPAGVQGDSPEVVRFVKVLERCRSLRRLGSCALNMCYVAAGRLDGYWATNVCAWDSAAGTVIAREAGAQLTAYNGDPLDDWLPRFCVTSSKPMQDTMVALLTGE
ncbi:inositol monophosphatase family protein [Rhodopirellula sp. MGV]|uniref:inositol monophosphatase family protein n=1 Tax=Rhodopirellula sp. MGV TaxID=2023130 RepID=UPI000B976154|nr:inositol monophosphatase family protein [Rhodopirellula sp. MGV]OYP37982.1 inositol monophosphatase [Rhodopirellula sp. MGV]PNY34282.1 inositol monophosphatase [Rhodopirellula baltica]